jgi:hypothetical protein
MVAFWSDCPMCLPDPSGRLSSLFVQPVCLDGLLSMDYLVEARSVRSSVVHIFFAQPQVDDTIGKGPATW